MDMHERIKEALGKKIKSWHDHSGRRVYLTVDKRDIIDVTKILFRDLGLRFAIASAVDTPDGFEILYHYSYDKTGAMYSVRVELDKKHPEIEAITPLFPGAEWIEREMWEMFGINFKGHPNLKRLLLADDWPEGKFPLRRSE
jgi:NADH:ubiquinone oxidoreductase subunit C